MCVAGVRGSIFSVHSGCDVAAQYATKVQLAESTSGVHKCCVVDPVPIVANCRLHFARVCTRCLQGTSLVLAALRPAQLLMDMAGLAHQAEGARSHQQPSVTSHFT